LIESDREKKRGDIEGERGRVRGIESG